MSFQPENIKLSFDLKLINKYENQANCTLKLPESLAIVYCRIFALFEHRISFPTIIIFPFTEILVVTSFG